MGAGCPPPHPASRTAERRFGRHLEGFSGYLHADAFAGYSALYRPDGQKPPRIAHVACMAHARRKLFEVFETTKSSIAEQALRQIQELYAIEAGIKGKSIGHGWRHASSRASRCSTPSRFGRSHSDDGSRETRRSARRSNSC